MEKVNLPDQSRVVFGASPDGAYLLLGIPAGAWEHMKDGNTCTADLRKFNMPQLIMFGGPTRESILDTLGQLAEGKFDHKTYDYDTDYGIKPEISDGDLEVAVQCVLHCRVPSAIVPPDDVLCGVYERLMAALAKRKEGE